MPDALFTVRRFEARSDLQDAFRVYLSSAALHSLRLAPGDACDIEPSNSDVVTGLAWPVSDKSGLGPRIAQVSSVVQDLCQLSLGAKVSLRPATQSAAVPRNIVLYSSDAAYRDSTAVHPGYWRRSLENLITEAGYVWIGMGFSLPRQRCSFRVVRIDYSETLDQLYRVGSATAITVDDHFTPSETPPIPPKLALDRAGVGGLGPQMDQIDARLEDYSGHLQFVQYPSYYQPFEGAVLLHGPAGTGKSLLLDRAARAAWKRVVRVDLYRDESGARPSAQSLQKQLAGIERAEPALLAVDGLELCTGEQAERRPEALRVASLLADEIRRLNRHRVFVVGATSDLRDLSPELRRAGCFEHLVELPPPDARTRTEILRIIMDGPDSAPDALLATLGERTHGYVGADLRRLVQAATLQAKARLQAQPHPPSYEESQNSGAATPGRPGVDGSAPPPAPPSLVVVAPGSADFEAALRTVRPSALQDVFLEPPRVRWADVGGQRAAREALQEAVEWPLKYPRLLAAFAAPPAKGLLLYGPPGCAKTMTAAALATATDLNFLAVKGAELLSMYVGESERAVRRVFARARAAAPAILFFDEIDAIGASRSAAAGPDAGADGSSSGGGGGDGGGNGGVGTTVLTTLLNELDGIEPLTNVFVLAATNRPDALDPALVRPGRLDRLLYVGLPDHAARRDILRVRLGRVDPARLAPELQPAAAASATPEDGTRAADADDAEAEAGDSLRERLAAATAGYSGAEVARVCERAALAAVREEVAAREGGGAPGAARAAAASPVRLGARHFERALREVPRMVTPAMLARYERWGRSIQPAAGSSALPRADVGAKAGARAVLGVNGESGVADGVAGLAL